MSESDTPGTDTPKKRNWFVRILVILAVLAVLAAAAAAAGLYFGHQWLQARFAEPGPTAEETVILMPRGEGLIAIAGRLEREGLITDRRIFRIAVTLDGGEGDLRAGEYAIPAGASMAEIYDILREGRTVQYPVTFAEGLTSAMIVRILNEAEHLTGDITEIPPEGSLLPETYLYTRGTSRQAILDRMHDAQQALLESLWENRAPDLPVETWEEAITLASVVEKETAVASERPEVAAVFVNRLRRGMRLESDPTIIYGITEGEPLGRGIRRSELDNADNLWNTYQHDGLPPTPIANPGAESIAAVLNPADSDALFFVADGTGGHVFSETYAEHQRNVRNWRRIERERRAAGQ